MNKWKKKWIIGADVGISIQQPNTPSLKFKCHQKEKDWDQAIGNVLGSQATI